MDLAELLKLCTVKLAIPGKTGWGTGFFVGADQILTCAHVVKAAGFDPVKVFWQGREELPAAMIERILPERFDLALLRLNELVENLPIVYLDTDVKPNDDLYAFGYPDDFPEGAPVTFSCEGLTGGTPSLLKFKLGQARPGLSGSPLLNMRTGKVCGMAKFTRDRGTDLGGGGIPTKVILSEFVELDRVQHEFHQTDRRWSDLLDDLSRFSWSNEGASDRPVDSIFNSPALDLWQKKLSYLQQQEAIAADPSIKFQLMQLIEECKQKITELGGKGDDSKKKLFKFDVINVDAKGQEISRDRSQAEYFTENLDKNVVLDVVLIPSGKFMMGSPKDEEDEYPQHEVTISSFFMGKYPVTQKQWATVASFPKVEHDLDPNPSHFKGDSRPVERISWFDAVEFCKRLSKATGRDYRLPSEAEWEYACRAKTITPFHYGETLTGELANYYCATETYADEPRGDFRGEATLVGSYPPNAFGLYDMHGNVREWCADHWHNSYRGHPHDGSPWLSNNENCARIARGGSWVNLPGYCRSALRGSNDPEHRDFNLGFRVMCSTIN
jgi:formylglycine-generating enzyme required for sulfatase activity